MSGKRRPCAGPCFSAHFASITCFRDKKGRFVCNPPRQFEFAMLESLVCSLAPYLYAPGAVFVPQPL